MDSKPHFYEVPMNILKHNGVLMVWMVVALAINAGFNIASGSAEASYLMLLISYVLLCSAQYLNRFKLCLRDNIQAALILFLTLWPGLAVVIGIDAIKSSAVLSFFFNQFATGFIYIVTILFAIFVVIQRKYLI
ncbi:hypothetical protein [Alteromonas gilva]|uniref:Uncharacterized protein n=1 Tax=Alteromonas gilva TaxID=2987522 RepID=A0ABT5L4S2_9ALTE|nr:hypothetical protein [Alteromonas gilva]MDC8832034.1 hypothetical protein [Alteromonas gilva]